ncbi:putative disease resistance protein [Sesamum alatum]|uniref:Disease resistance protein n=1 Tax=Sesamum alatum TaxID=300844 RepID=A0AAE1Y7W8_9LAMI|nr:putative disease resistance protein [Sesamum alatum]
MVDSVATIALETLRDLLIEEVRFLAGVSGEVEEVREQLKQMHAFLKDADRRQDKYNSETVRNWVVELRDLSIKAENVLETYAIEVMSKSEATNLKNILKRFTCILSECSSVRQTGEEIKVIRSRMSGLTKQLESMSIGGISSTSVDDTDWSRKTYGHEIEEHFVGMKKDVEKLESLLTSDGRSNRVISICGMGGMGKTTLANKIYKGEAVERWFEFRAWICISQQFKVKIVLQELLKQFLPKEREQEVMQMSENQLVTNLYNMQKEKKCLVVLDDIWEIDHWNILSHAFPIAESDSKVLLTTRNQNIASREYVHVLECLSEDEGWTLLQKIALQTNCSQEPTAKELMLLEEIGRDIVKKCGCLPLPIYVIGGILRQEKSLAEWVKVRRNIDSYLQHGKGVEKDKRVLQILDLSYDVHPYNLKPCFLYLGCFQEDQDIDTEGLYLIWMAEGLISSEDRGNEETLRDVAERYLSELANRCMIYVKMDPYSIYNRFKSCRLHDLMRDLCLLKGKEKGFVEVVDRQVGREEEFSICRTVRLVIHLDELEDDHIYNIGKNKKLRSLLFLGKGWDQRAWNNLKGINFGMFRFIKILILEGYIFKNGKFPKGIGKLILLKFLSIQKSEVEELPPSVSKLSCVQSLNLRVNEPIKLPNFIHKMRRLRHLFLPRTVRSVIGGGKLELDGLNDLETMCGFDSSVVDTAHVLKLQKLRVLDGTIHDEESLSMILDHILNHQDQFLETKLYVEEGSTLLRRLLMCHSLSLLRIKFRVSKLPAYEQNLYRNVTQLLLLYSNIEEDPMETLEKLPMLRDLRLFFQAYVGREMVCGATGFPQLRRLFLCDLPNLVEWRVEKGAMPNLDMIYIRHCNKLEMMPNDLKFITTLKQLTVSDMPMEFINRLLVVDGEEGEDYHKIKHIPYITFQKDLER